MAAGWKDALMADTGAPWNIPYVEPSDLVRDYPAADEAQALAIAAGLTAAGNAGIGANVVSVAKTDTFVTTSTGFTSVTGLSLTITPSTDTSKILLIASVSLGNTNVVDGGAFLRLTGGNAGNYVGDADGSRTRATIWRPIFANSERFANTHTAVFLDAPATESPVTYAVEMRVGAGTGTINRSPEDTNAADRARVPSSITAIEVAV
jgi:hypothetical protein